MAWVRFPVTNTEPAAFQHMNEIEDAIVERSDLLDQMSPFGGSGVPAIHTVVVDDYGRYMQEHREVLATGINGDTLLYPYTAIGIDYQPCASTEANDFKTIIKGAAGAGEINFNVEAGISANNDWEYDTGLATDVPPGDYGRTFHPNHCYTVLNRLIRFKTIDNHAASPFDFYNDGAATPSGKTTSDAVWATAMTAAAAAAGTYPAAPGGWPPFYPTLGRIFSYDPIAGNPPYNCEVAVSLECRSTVDLTDAIAQGYTHSDAWLCLERFSASVLTTTAEFTFDVQVNGNIVGSYTSGDAADITGFLTCDGNSMDVWVMNIDAEIDDDGNNLVSLHYTDTVTGDPGTAFANMDYSQGIAPANVPHLAFVIEYDHFVKM